MPPFTRSEIVDGVAVITIDNPPVNALTPGVLAAIEESVTRGTADPGVSAFVLIGAGTTFVAGVDINSFAALKTREEVLARMGAMHERLKWIEDASKPVVAAISGYALGGGLELAMACHYRVASADAAVGQPEVLLGLIPGAGGTQRLPRLCGTVMALDMCTGGQPIAAARALAAGILDRTIDGGRQRLLDAAVTFARDRAATHEIRRTRDLGDTLTDIDAALRACDERRAALAGIAQSPAPYAAVNAIEAASMLPFDAGAALERELFADCVLSDASRALVHLFFAEREVAKVSGVPKDTPTLDVRRAAVVGAGAMGCGIALTYANAGIPVLLKDADRSALERELQTIRRDFESSASPGGMAREVLERGTALITPTATFDGFEAVDIVTEATDDITLKTSAFAELGRVTRPDCLLASNVSTPAIDELARASGRPSSVIGHHFSSPPHLAKLLEIVRGRATAPEAVATSLKLAKRLGKVGVVVGNCAGFVADRLLASYVREAHVLIEEGASALQIDRALTRFGMAAGPFAMTNTAGIDALRVRQEGARPATPPRALTDDEIANRVATAIAREGARVLEEGCASRPADIDVISCYALGFPRARGGPMHYARSGGSRTLHLPSAS